MCICSIELEWLCLGNPTAHHDVMPCAPEKIPEFLLQVFVYTFKMKYSIAFGLISQSSSSSSSFDEKLKICPSFQYRIFHKWFGVSSPSLNAERSRSFWTFITLECSLS